MKFIATTLLLFLCVSAASEEGAKNPYLTAKVGDWAKYRISGEGEKKIENRFMKKTVESVTEQEVSVKMEILTGEKVVSTRTEKFALDKPHSIRTQHKTGVVTLNATGAEKIKAAGKEFEATWTTETIVDFVGDWEMTQVIRIWASVDAPLDGMVKSEGETTQKSAKAPDTLKRPAQKFLIELVEFGRK